VRSSTLPEEVNFDCVQVVASVRVLSSLPPGDGPDDDYICAGVRGFVEAFDFRYIQVIRKSVKKYRSVIIQRINPLIRRFQLEELSAADVANRLIGDWAARNFVTAGGFAIEALAVGVSSEAQKSGTEGVDLQVFDQASATYHLYVLKSGLVTRNSDILKALKANSRKAEKILRGDKSVMGVTANYAIASGKTSSTVFEDGVQRLSTQDFWAHMTGLPPQRAVDLTLAMAAEAGRLVRQDAKESLKALQILVQCYLGDSNDPTKVDWPWVERRTMLEKQAWKEEDKARNATAVAALAAAGYGLDGTVLEPGEAPPTPEEVEAADAEAGDNDDVVSADDLLQEE
jgi:hypothetical protein